MCFTDVCGLVVLGVDGTLRTIPTVGILRGGSFLFPSEPYRSGGAQKVQLKVVFLILKYYLGLALCIDSYVVGFFCPSC